MTDTVQVLVIGENCLYRCGLAALLQTSGFTVSTMDMPPSEPCGFPLEAGEFDIVVWDVSSKAVDAQSIGAALEKVFASTRVMLVVRDEVDCQVLRHVTGRLDGLIHSTASADEFLSVLRLVVDGTRVFSGIIVDRLVMNKAREDTRPNPHGLAQTAGVTISRREVQVARLVATGMSNKEIARELHLAEGTVKVHLRRIAKRLELNNRSKIAVWAKQNLPGPAVTEANHALARTPVAPTGAGRLSASRLSLDGGRQANLRRRATGAA